MGSVQAYIFVPGVTQRNENTGSVQGIILLFFCCKSGEVGGIGSRRFPCVTPVLESFSSDLVRATISYWAVSLLKSCQTSSMEFLCKNSQRP